LDDDEGTWSFIGCTWCNLALVDFSFSVSAFTTGGRRKKCALFLSLNHETSIIILRPQSALRFLWGKLDVLGVYERRSPRFWALLLLPGESQIDTNAVVNCKVELLCKRTRLLLLLVPCTTPISFLLQVGYRIHAPASKVSSALKVELIFVWGTCAYFMPCRTKE